jgi:voltage-gated potassium channel
MTTLADSLWWAATTVTTVGYGDTFPVTATGRLVAVALMLVGISLVSVITATVATWFLAQTREAAEDQEADLAARLTRLETTLCEIHAILANPTTPAGASQDDQEHSPPVAAKSCVAR